MVILGKRNNSFEFAFNGNFACNKVCVYNVSVAVASVEINDFDFRIACGSIFFNFEFKHYGFTVIGAVIKSGAFPKDFLVDSPDTAIHTAAGIAYFFKAGGIVFDAVVIGPDTGVVCNFHNNGNFVAGFTGCGRYAESGVFRRKSGNGKHCKG